MALWKKRELTKLPYDPETQAPALRQSICTGEMTLGFVEKKSGKFHEYELARDQGEVEAFCRRAGIEPGELRKIY